jgi:hypothetical protein
MASKQAHRAYHLALETLETDVAARFGPGRLVMQSQAGKDRHRLRWHDWSGKRPPSHPLGEDFRTANALYKAVEAGLQGHA